MISKIELLDLIDIDVLHYIGAGHYAVINGSEYEFIKSYLDWNPVKYEHDLFKMNAEVPGCYLITDLETRKTYVGSSGKPYLRITIHKGFIRGKKHDNPNLNNLIQNRTLSDFELTVFFTKDREEAYRLEQFFINFFMDRNLALNVGIDVRSPFKGISLSEEHKKNISLANMGREVSEETKIKISLANTNPSQETKDKLSLSRKTSPLALQQLATIQQARKRSIHVEGNDYNTIEDAINATGYSESYLRREIIRSPKEVYWTSDNASSITGVKWDEDRKQKLRDYRQTDKAKAQLESIRDINRKKILLNGVLYSSVTEAVSVTGISEATLHKQLRINNGKEGDIYVLDYVKRIPNKVKIGDVIYNSISVAAETLGVDRYLIKGWVRYKKAEYVL